MLRGGGDSLSPFAGRSTGIALGVVLVASLGAITAAGTSIVCAALLVATVVPAAADLARRRTNQWTTIRRKSRPQTTD